jgi:hypothetical protein
VDVSEQRFVSSLSTVAKESYGSEFVAPASTSLFTGATVVLDGETFDLKELRSPGES